MARAPQHPVDVKLKIVLSVLSGESTQAEAARRHGISETSIGKWKGQFLEAGRRVWPMAIGPAGRPAARRACSRKSTISPGLSGRRTSSCACSSVVARRACGFAELEQLRTEHGLSVQRFCEIVGLPVRTFYDRRARHRAGQRSRAARGRRRPATGSARP